MNASNQVDGDKVEKLEKSVMNQLMSAEAFFLKSLTYFEQMSYGEDDEELKGNAEVARVTAEVLHPITGGKRSRAIDYLTKLEMTPMEKGRKTKKKKEAYLKANALAWFSLADEILQENLPDLETLANETKDERYEELAGFLREFSKGARGDVKGDLEHERK